MRISGFIDAIASGAELHEAAKQFGVRDDEIDVVRRKSKLLYAKTDIRTFPSEDGVKASTRPRAFEGAKGMLQLWDALESGGEGSQMVEALADDWYTYDDNRGEKSIRLSGAGWNSLKRLLGTEYAVSPESIEDDHTVYQCSVATGQDKASRRSLNRNLRWILAIAWITIQTLEHSQPN
jgi:hypothetical protein